MQSVLMLVKTTGVQYDDRVRKECESLKRAGLQPEIAAVEYANEKRTGETPWGTPFRALRLRTRAVGERGRALPVKVAEMSLRFVLILLRRRPDVVWLHNMELAVVVAVAALLRRFGLIERVVWDQHELPPPSAVVGCRGRAFRWLAGLPDAVVVANRERLEWLRGALGPDSLPHARVIENLADRAFAAAEPRPLPDDLEQWLDGRPYLLAQGGANPGRYLEQVIAAALAECAALVVVGPFLPSVPREIEATWGPDVWRNVRLTGLVPQARLRDYIDRAEASIVLYDDRIINSRLCAPNRLYQALARGRPVIAGRNPPMARTVMQTGAGIVLESDGRDADDLKRALARFRREGAVLAEAARNARETGLWDEQDPVIREIATGSGSTGAV